MNLSRFTCFVFVLSVACAGCARPAAPEPAPKPVPVALELPQPPPIGEPGGPHLAPEPRPARHSRFFSKLSAAKLDDTALGSAPKDPQWKWLSVFSGMSLSSKPGTVNYIEAGRYLTSTPAGVECFLQVLKGELEDAVRKSGATINDQAGAKPAAPAEGFSFSYIDGNASGTVRVTVTRQEDGR